MRERVRDTSERRRQFSCIIEGEEDVCGQRREVDVLSRGGREQRCHTSDEVTVKRWEQCVAHRSRSVSGSGGSEMLKELQTLRMDRTQEGKVWKRN